MSRIDTPELMVTGGLISRTFEFDVLDYDSDWVGRFQATDGDLLAVAVMGAPRR